MLVKEKGVEEGKRGWAISEPYLGQTWASSPISPVQPWYALD